MEPRPCVVFDFDGTLADSVDGIVGAVSDTLSRYGYPRPAPAEIVDHMGRGLTALYGWAASLGAEKDMESMIADTRKRYSEIWRDHTRIFPGIPELLIALRARGAVLGVLSNKGHESTVKVANDLFPAGTFDAIHGIAEGWPGKPNPEGLLRLLDAVGSAPNRALMVGDMSVDVRVGRAAGVRTVGVAWGFQGAAAFAADPPDEMVAVPKDILGSFDAILNG